MGGQSGLAGRLARQRPADEVELLGPPDRSGERALDFTSDALLSVLAVFRKKRSASVALKAFSFVTPIAG
jgi:hypothetical protein